MISIIGENIKRIRELKKMSGNALSKRAGVSSSTISELESGNRATSKGDTLEKIAAALGVTVGDLLGDEETVSFATNDIEDIFNIVNYSGCVTLDGQELSDAEKQSLNNLVQLFTNSIRYNRK